MGTLWQPDTCECAIEYDLDFRIIKTHNVCSKHARYANKQAHFDNVLAHNQEKNYVVKHLKDEGVDVEKVFVGYDIGVPENDDPVVIAAEDDIEFNKLGAAMAKYQGRAKNKNNIRKLSKG